MSETMPAEPPLTVAAAALPTARVVATLCTIATALQIGVPAIVFALEPGAPRSVVVPLFLFALPATYVAASGVTAIGIGRAARFALAARREVRDLRPFVLLALGLVYAFATPFGVVVALGEGGSLFWYLVYGLFQPGCLLVGAQVTLLGSTIPIRTDQRLSILAVVAVPALAAGTLLLVYSVARSFVPELIPAAGIALAGIGLGLDVTIAVLAGTALRAR